MTIPTVLTPDAGLDEVDAMFDAATVVRGVPDPVGDVVRADPAVAAHMAAADDQGRRDARQVIFPLRAAVLPAAEAAAAPYVERLRANDAAFNSGALAEKFGRRALARAAHDVDDRRLRAEMSAAVRAAVAPYRARLDDLERNFRGIIAAADELPTPAPEALDALRVLIGILPNLTPEIAVTELERAVSAAARDAGARGNLRYLLPVTRSLAVRPEFAETSDVGIGLRVVIRRAEALARDRRHVTAELFSRYAGRLRYELGIVESAVASSGSWAAAPDAAITTAQGGGPLKAVIVPPRAE